MSEHDGPKEGRATHPAQALAAAARRYVPTETLTRRKPQEETGTALHRGLGLGATRSSGSGVPARRAPGSRRKRTAGKTLIAQFLKPAASSLDIAATPSIPPPMAPAGAESILVDPSKSLLASQSALNRTRDEA